MNNKVSYPFAAALSCPSMLCARVNLYVCEVANFQSQVGSRLPVNGGGSPFAVYIDVLVQF